MQSYAEVNYHKKQKTNFISRNEVLDLPEKKKVAQKHFNSQGTILTVAEEIDTSARHRLTLTFVVMHNKNLMSGNFIQNHVNSYFSQRNCLNLHEGKTVSPLEPPGGLTLISARLSQPRRGKCKDSPW